MKIIDEKLMRETNEFTNVRDAEDYQYKSVLVKELYEELRKMAEQYYEWGLQRRHGGDQVIQAMVNLKAKGAEKKKALIKTIEDFKKTEQEESLREHQKKSTEKQISIAEAANEFAREANHVSKAANTIAEESLKKADDANTIAKANLASVRRANNIAGVAVAVSLISIGVSVVKDTDIESKVRVAVDEKIGDKFVSDVSSRIQKNIELNGFSKDALNEEIQSALTRKVETELKPKLISEISNEVVLRLRQKKTKPKAPEQ